MTVVSVDDCWICHQRIAGNLAAIGRSGALIRYVPFVRDLKPGALTLAHPVCFAVEHGVEALVLLVHEHDFEIADRRESRPTSIRKTR